MQLPAPTDQPKPQTPWLIQRGRILPATPTTAPERLSQQVKTDYMGSSEFEFGAMACSLRRISACSAAVVLPLYLGKQKLFVYTSQGSKFFKTYAGLLKDLRFNNPRLKEASHFGADYVPFDTKHATDFWWDLENDVMWSFDEDFMVNRLRPALQASFAVMKLT